MFFERLKELCAKNGTTPTAVTIKLGYDRSNVTYWKSSKIPNGDIVSKFAGYFNVSTDYLLCKTDAPTPPGKKADDTIDEPIFITMQSYYKELPVEDKEQMDMVLKTIFTIF